jgi:translation initiation factor IF-1
MTEQAALVVATYSRRMRLLLHDGRRVDARIKGKRLRPVCGDLVEAEPIAASRTGSSLQSASVITS